MFCKECNKPPDNCLCGPIGKISSLITKYGANTVKKWVDELEVQRINKEITYLENLVKAGKEAEEKLKKLIP